MTTLYNIETTKIAVLEPLSEIKSYFFPNGKEDDLKSMLCLDENNKRTRLIWNSHISTRRCITEFLQQRHDCEQKNIINRFKLFLNTQNATGMIPSVRYDVEKLFNTINLSQFSYEAIGLYAAENLPAPRNITYFTEKLYYYSKITTPNTLISKLVQTYISLTPHSCGPERAVSCHTILKTKNQSNYSRGAINSRLFLDLNSCGTAHFVPRPSVLRFEEKKQHQYKLLDELAYKDHVYTKKFFKKV